MEIDFNGYSCGIGGGDSWRIAQRHTYVSQKQILEKQFASGNPSG